MLFILFQSMNSAAAVFLSGRHRTKHFSFPMFVEEPSEYLLCVCVLIYFLQYGI